VSSNSENNVVTKLFYVHDQLVVKILFIVTPNLGLNLIWASLHFS